MNENNVQNADNQAALYDLIQSIQTKINVDQNSTETKNDNNINNNKDEKIEKTEFNINNNDQNLNFSSILNNIDLNSLLSNFNSNTNKDNNNNENNNINFSDIDPNTLFRIQKIISKISRNNPKKDLLRSLKPFLRKSRQDKIGEYMTILSIVDAIDIFGSKGSD